MAVMSTRQAMERVRRRLRSPAEPRRGPGPQARLAAVLAGIVAFALAVGCGESGSQAPTARITPDRPAPAADSFPSAEGRSLDEVIAQADPPSTDDPVATAATQVFYPGTNRYALTLKERDQEEITAAEAALYIAPIPPPDSGRSAYDEPAQGPFPARLVSLATSEAFRSDSTLENPYSATAYYLAELPFPGGGDWRVEILIRHRDRLIAKSLPRAAVDAYRGIPSPGQQPPRISTPTAADVDGNLADLTTRRPPDSQNEVDFASVLGERPIALLFTSPAFCQSRICGPVTDVAEQVKNEVGERADVIHMEIYNENDPDRGVRPQVRRFNLPSDTWLFVIGADGRVRQAVEGPFGSGEMRNWLEEAIQG